MHQCHRIVAGQSAFVTSITLVACGNYARLDWPYAEGAGFLPWGRVYPPAPNRHQAGKHIRLGAAWQIVLRLYAGMQIHSMRGMNHGQTRCNRRLSRFGKMGSWLLPSAKSSYALLLACVPVPHLQSRTYRRWGPVRDINIWARRFFESRKKYASGGIGHTPVGGPGNRGRGYAPPPAPIRETPSLNGCCMAHQNPPVCKWP